LIDSLLIANRGEIACRIIRTCRRLGIRSVAVFSEVDREGPWVRAADEAFWLGEAPATQSYLNIKALLRAARESGAQAVHPGFGFLAENADFARACEADGLIWVGPTPDSMDALGSKVRAKQLAAAAEVPVLAGYGGDDQSLDTLRREAERTGYPLMIKAAAGGGGKGMRRVNGPAELEPALRGARSEALNAFGDDRLLLERALDRARHVEVQVLGDAYGGLVHLGERDCSLQRRHQKVLEETPAPGLSERLRSELHGAALRLARAAQYRSAGTVEFLVHGEQFYFLEMNTRLQVEHPVTEEVTGIDLVEWQLRIAEGESLPWSSAPAPRGHAVEARLYAEDPAQDGRPSTGTILLWRAPDGVRVECGINDGQTISPFYDPMVAKIITHGSTRAEAIRRLRRALEQTVLLGVASNRDQLLTMLRLPSVLAAEMHVGTLAEPLPPLPQLDDQATAAAALAQWLSLPGRYWRNTRWEPERWHFEGYPEVTLHSTPAGLLLNGEPVLAEWREPELTVEFAGRRTRYVVALADNEVWVSSPAAQGWLRQKPRFPGALRRAQEHGAVTAPLTGAVTEVLVQPGQQVEEGQLLLRLEAMKMDHRLVSPVRGEVQEVLCQAGEVVQAQSVLVKVHPQLAGSAGG
jgi:geranyl-CoA carboxylase alpha subunit